MTIEEANQKATEWSNLIADAECEAENECHGASERLLAEAREIEKEINAAGYSANLLLKQIEARRRAL